MSSASTCCCVPSCRLLWIGIVCSVLFAGTLGVGSVQATTVVTSDKTTFLDGMLAGYYPESFSSLTQSNYGEPLSFSDGTGTGYAYDVTTSTAGGIYVAPPDTGNLSLLAISPVDIQSSLTFTFTGAGVTAFAGNLFPVDNGGFLQSGALSILLSDGTQQTLTASALDSQPFIGFWSDTPLSTVTISFLGTDYYPAATNIIVGKANPSFVSVPEPGTVPLFLIGTVLFVGGIRFVSLRRLWG